MLLLCTYPLAPTNTTQQELLLILFNNTMILRSNGSLHDALKTTIQSALLPVAFFSRTTTGLLATTTTVPCMVLYSHERQHSRTLRASKWWCCQRFQHRAGTHFQRKETAKQRAIDFSVPIHLTTPKQERIINCRHTRNEP